MKIVERIESKLDDVRDMIHIIDLKASGTVITQIAHKEEMDAMKAEIAALKSSHDQQRGAWKLLTLPGILSLLYAISQILAK